MDTASRVAVMKECLKKEQQALLRPNNVRCGPAGYTPATDPKSQIRAGEWWGDEHWGKGGDSTLNNRSGGLYACISPAASRSAIWTLHCTDTSLGPLRTEKSARIKALRAANTRESVLDELMKQGKPKPLNDAMDASRGGHLHWPRTSKDPREEARSNPAVRSTLYPSKSASELSVRPGPPDPNLPAAKVTRPLRREGTAEWQPKGRGGVPELWRCSTYQACSSFYGDPEYRGTYKPYDNRTATFDLVALAQGFGKT
jgi:hypothetical protein